MKISRLALFSAVAAALAFAAPSSVDAQAIIGVHGTLADVRDVSPGLGGSIAFLRNTGNNMDVGVEVLGTYYFPNCTGFECDAWGGEAVLMGVRALGGRARSYAGVGAKYVKLDVASGGDSSSGESWGVVVKFGSSYQTEGALAPFFDFGWGFMDASADIWEARLGLRFALGARR